MDWDVTGGKKEMERNSAAPNQAMRKYYQSGQAAKLGSETNIYIFYEHCKHRDNSQPNRDLT